MQEEDDDDDADNDADDASCEGADTNEDNNKSSSGINSSSSRRSDVARSLHLFVLAKKVVEQVACFAMQVDYNVGQGLVFSRGEGTQCRQGCSEVQSTSTSSAQLYSGVSTAFLDFLIWHQWHV